MRQDGLSNEHIIQLKGRCKKNLGFNKRVTFKFKYCHSLIWDFNSIHYFVLLLNPFSSLVNYCDMLWLSLLRLWTMITMIILKSLELNIVNIFTIRHYMQVNYPNWVARRVHNFLNWHEKKGYISLMKCSIWTKIVKDALLIYWYINTN